MAAPRVTKKKKPKPKPNQTQTVLGLFQHKENPEIRSENGLAHLFFPLSSLNLLSFFPPRLSFVSPPALLLLLPTMTIKQARRRDQGLIDDSRRHRVV